MGQSKHTKKALLASVLSIVACCALLIGSTFAWFTDSVTSGNNKIVAGNLDIKLSYQNGATNGFEEVTSNTTNLFVTKEGKDILWEPGVAAVTYLKMENAGSLALKYLLSIAANDVVTGDDGAALSKVLKSAAVVIGEGDVGKYDRATAIEKAEAAGADSVLNYNRVFLMKPETVKYVALIVYFPEEVGNVVDNAVYNRSDVQLQTDLSLNLFATQLAYEYDSFGNDYDLSAATFVKYDATKSAAENGQALKDIVAAAPAGATVYVGAGVYDVYSNGANLVLDKPINLIGAGTLTSSKGNGNGDEQATVVIKSSDVTLDGLTINMCQDPANANKVVEIASGSNVVVRNCVLNALEDFIGVYVGGPEVGAYRIENNIITGKNTVGVIISNGAGNAMAEGEKAIVSGNDCEGALYLTGTRNTAWDLNELTKLPEITGNTFGMTEETRGGRTFDLYIRVASKVEENLVDCTDIIAHNEFRGVDATLAGTTVEEDGTYYVIYGWGTDRAEPADFAYDAAADAFRVTVDGSTFNADSFRKTQGKKLPVVCGDSWTISADITVTEEMAQGNTPYRVELWTSGLLNGEVVSYPCIGVYSDGSGSAKLRVFDGVTSDGWHNTTTNVTAGKYTVSMSYTAGQNVIHYAVDGVDTGMTIATDVGTTVKEAFLQVYNYNKSADDTYTFTGEFSNVTCE